MDRKLEFYDPVNNIDEIVFRHLLETIRFTRVCAVDVDFSTLFSSFCAVTIEISGICEKCVDAQNRLNGN